jgi:hypothetical protein
MLTERDRVAPWPLSQSVLTITFTAFLGISKAVDILSGCGCAEDVRKSG